MEKRSKERVSSKHPSLGATKKSKGVRAMKAVSSKHPSLGAAKKSKGVRAMKAHYKGTAAEVKPHMIAGAKAIIGRHAIVKHYKHRAAAEVKARVMSSLDIGPLLTRYFEQDGRVDIVQATEAFGMSRVKLAETVGIAPATLQRTARADAPKTQTRLREMVEIIARVADWAGGEVQATAWYRAEPIPAFGGRTAEALVKEGKAAAVRDYLDSVALGGFA
jgi:uncharacterized protein (DUF2384 family)